MNTFFAGQKLGEVFLLVLNALLEKGAKSSPRGLQTRELRSLGIQIEKPHARFLKLSNLNYSLIFLKQLLFIGSKDDPSASLS